MPSSDRVRHAVSRSTGATTWTRVVGDEWKTTCLNHGSETTAPSRGQAWKNGSTPSNFCAKCKSIAAGKSPMITEGKLPLPKAKAAPKVVNNRKPKTAPAAKTTKAAVKAPAKKAAVKK